MQGICTYLAPSIESAKQAYPDEIQVLTAEHIAEKVYLMEGGLLLYALLAGGDYSKGVAGCGPAISLGLVRCGFGDDLLSATESMDLGGHEADNVFADLRRRICSELETNCRGLLGSCHPTVARDFPDTFPDRDILKLYHKPAISSTSCQLVNSVGPSGSWPFQEPSISRIAQFSRENFGWKDEAKLKQGMTKMWEAAVFQMLYSVRNRSYIALQ